MPNRRKAFLAVLVAGSAWALLAASGPASAQQEDTSLATLRQEVHQLAESVQGARQDLLVVQRTQARTMATIEDLQTVVQTVDAKLEEFNHRLRELALKLEALQAALARRPLTPPELPAAAGPPPEETAPAEATGVSPAPQAGPEVAAAPRQPEEAETQGLKPPELQPPEPTPALQPEPPAGPITREQVEVAVLNPREIFRAAQEDYSKGNFDLAVLGFRDYLRKYPATELAPNAQYWLGEIYLSQQDYARAVEEFQRLLDLYPASPQVPTTLYKQALAYQALKKYDEARANLEAVVSRYPTTAEAKQAVEVIKSLPADQ